ncbi:aldo/keto reductase [Bradyrhizobium sp. U87765 SZCCT0131]|uniref:aldo/keto reductase n=1 Tax=unclassified Bradyrhizobium TaxID=2631580 RepID=UPI001BADA83D|nr:aldo/keto reductase [Bradyrhizobium sp. U87765 SZCCT0131]MBR1263843.1 aldo/keto reductase [Bradyrhizobium sp. U87765 SZCCT0134]MBR1302587.1 aldo/keto reductase [Bradyrhizobium sp. U87765 SZCCT0110]MBR1320093.1 aldo/keto reductase [Bradyrhizobium sp. U87765 SZCCT0109]MBR1348794.1 aldo/keto reductase [Bradyrhizobium sp. U87765 SZCCT0048]
MTTPSPRPPTSSLPVRRLGRSRLNVSTIGFGAAPIGDLYGHLDDATAIAAVNSAFDAGMTLFDMAPLYGHGLAEHRCGTALRRHPRDAFVVSTKVGRWMDPTRSSGARSGYIGGLPHAAVIDYSYDGTLRAFEQSLLRTGLPRIDILLIHDVDVWTHGKDAIERRFGEAMDGAYRALERLRAEKAIAAIGVGVNEAEMCERFAHAGDFDVMLLAGRYSLLEQPALHTFLPTAARKDIGVMLGGVFNSGILATGARPGAHYNYTEAPPAIMARVARIEAVCDAHNVKLADAALQFPLAHPAIASVVLGATSPQEVERNVAALTRPIPATLWRDLKSEGLLDADVPVPTP